MRPNFSPKPFAFATSIVYTINTFKESLKKVFFVIFVPLCKIILWCQHLYVRTNQFLWPQTESLSRKWCHYKICQGSSSQIVCFHFRFLPVSYFGHCVCIPFFWQVSFHVDCSLFSSMSHCVSSLCIFLPHSPQCVKAVKYYYITHRRNRFKYQGISLYKIRFWNLRNNSVHYTNSLSTSHSKLVSQAPLSRKYWQKRKSNVRNLAVKEVNHRKYEILVGLWGLECIL